MGADFVLTTEAAEIIGVSPDTIRVWERSGRLPAHKTSRGVRLFGRADCIRLAQNREIAAYLLNFPPDVQPQPEKERDAVLTAPR
jgi:excisionase family DNA binding protein